MQLWAVVHNVIAHALHIGRYFEVGNGAVIRQTPVVDVAQGAWQGECAHFVLVVTVVVKSHNGIGYTVVAHSGGYDEVGYIGILDLQAGAGCHLVLLVEVVAHVVDGVALVGVDCPVVDALVARHLYGNARFECLECGQVIGAC